jgi:hypothetical protein
MSCFGGGGGSAADGCTYTFKESFYKIIMRNLSVFYLAFRNLEKRMA